MGTWIGCSGWTSWAGVGWELPVSVFFLFCAGRQMTNSHFMLGILSFISLSCTTFSFMSLSLFLSVVGRGRGHSIPSVVPGGGLSIHFGCQIRQA